MAQWMTIKPIDFCRSLSSGADLGNVKIIQIPDSLRNMQGLNYLSFIQKERFEDSEFMFVCEYQADSLGDVDKEWKGEKQRSKQDAATESILFANLAMWIVKPTGISGKTVFHVENIDSYPVMRQASSVFSYLPNSRYATDEFGRVELNCAKDLNLILQSLSKKSSLWVPIHSLIQALTAPYPEVRFLLLWVALESLFGCDSEITHKISERIAFFLGSRKGVAKEIYEKVRRSYKLRSKIVHGRDVASQSEQSEGILYETEFFVRDSLFKILENSQLRGVFDGQRREEYLNNLIFQ